jgi:CheY-like chemotaxis protein
MTPYDCIIIDDNVYAINGLKKFIDLMPNVSVRESFTDPLTALLELEGSDPIDLLFMDIDMPHITGIELSKTLRKKTKKLIFTTAYIGAITSVNPTIATLAFGMLAPTGGPVLTISSGLTLTANGGFTLAAAGANPATTAIINGPGNFKLAGNSIIASGEGLEAALNLVITLASVNATITVSSGGTFILGSDQNGSAAIDVIPGMVSNMSPRIKGTVEVDRYVTGNSVSTNRNYRFYTSPVHDPMQVSGNYVISVNYLLQQGPVSTPFGTMYYGNNVYGVGGTANGFNISGPNPTIYFLAEDHISATPFSNGYYRGISNMVETSGNPVIYGITLAPSTGSTNYSIPIGNGFIAYFVDGNGSTVSAPVSSVMPATGILNQGTINFVNWETPTSPYLEDVTTSPDNLIAGNNFVGNPYPCTIDLGTSGTQNSFTNMAAPIYAPGTSGIVIEQTALGGSYGNFNTQTGAYTNNASEYIQSGAGFSVIATSSTAKLQFSETAKAPTQQITTAGGTGVYMAVLHSQQANRQYLRLEMNADTVHKEDILIWFDKSSNVSFKPMEDGLYMRGFNTVSLSSLSSDGVQLGINAQPLPLNERRLIGLNTDMANSGTYHFNLREVVGLSQLYDVLLLDNYQKDSVDLRKVVTYDFNVDKSDSASFGNKRFSILIKQNPAYAYQLLNFDAGKIIQAKPEVKVIWSTQNEANYTTFFVERSTDGGKTFIDLGSMNSAAIGTYSYNDMAPIMGLNFYRLKQIDVNSNITYSKTIIVGYNNAEDETNGPKLSIYPNPASDQISLAFVSSATDQSIYNVTISNLSGIVLKQFTLAQTTWQRSVSELQHGVYYIRVHDNKTQKLVAVGKFSKL